MNEIVCLPSTKSPFKYPTKGHTFSSDVRGQAARGTSTRMSQFVKLLSYCDTQTVSQQCAW